MTIFFFLKYPPALSHEVLMISCLLMWSAKCVPIFPTSLMVILFHGFWNAEEETDPYRLPTKQNMRMALYWLVQGCQPGDSLLFHYSGHGSRQRNFSGDEVDGYDETLCPLDFETQGMIVDDEINATIVRPLPHGVKLHAIIDACHSGTVLDLPFLCRMNRWVLCCNVQSLTWSSFIFPPQISQLMISIQEKDTLPIG